MFKFPYTNFHEMNLTWIIETVKNLTEEVAFANARESLIRITRRLRKS